VESRIKQREVDKASATSMMGKLKKISVGKKKENEEDDNKGDYPVFSCIPVFSEWSRGSTAPVELSS